MKETKYQHSEAEDKFYFYMKEKYPDLEITKKGLPDFMIMNKQHNILGFVEVKRTDLYDGLRTEQVYFREYCKKNKIPYHVWSPNMARKNWENYKNKQVWTQKTTNWSI